VLITLRYVARGLPVAVVGGVLALAIAPATISLLTGKEELSGAVLAAVVIGAAVVAFAADDAAGPTLAAVPVSLARRRGMRLACLAAALAVTWCLVLAAVTWRDPAAAGPLLDRLAEGAAVAGVALAAAGFADRQDLPVGPAALAGPVGALMVTAFAYRYPQLPAIGGQGQAAKWAWVAAAGWLAAAWESRDPYGFAPRRPDR
jgi:hypothetical protein